MLVCVLFYPLHTRPRVQRASGIPCALEFSSARKFLKTSGGSRRENANVCVGSSSLLKNLEIESFSYFDRSLLGRHGGVGCNFEAGVGRILPRWWLSGKQFGNADQVIGDQIEQEVGGDASDAAMLGLAHGAMLLAPAEDALDHGSA